MSFTYEFPKHSGTASMVFFYGNEVLLAKRSPDSDAYPNTWSIPGGYNNAAGVDNEGHVYEGETIEATAIRETKEEVGIDLNESDLHLFHVSSNPSTDPRAHVINVCYYIVLNSAQREQIQAGDDVSEVKFVSFEEALHTHLAFDHDSILFKAIMKYNARNL